MLAAEYGGLRPWELNELTPYETRQLHAMRAQLLASAEEV